MSTRRDPPGSRTQSTVQRLMQVRVADTPSSSKNAAQMSNVPPPAILVELVERFQVCWETLPEFSILGTEKRRIGFALELYGHHSSPAEHPPETCIHCHNVFGSLHVIADWALSHEKRATMLGAEVHFPCLAYSPTRQKPLEVRFAIRVVHRGATENLDEERMEQWSREIEWRLRQLGAVGRMASTGRSES